MIPENAKKHKSSPKQKAPKILIFWFENFLRSRGLLIADKPINGRVVRFIEAR